MSKLQIDQNTANTLALATGTLTSILSTALSRPITLEELPAILENAELQAEIHAAERNAAVKLVSGK